MAKYIGSINLDHSRQLQSTQTAYLFHRRRNYK